MIHPISTPKCGRADICISLSDKNLRRLIETWQPLFLLAETGMEQETVAVAEAVAAKMTDGKSMEIDIFDEHLKPRSPTQEDDLNESIAKILTVAPQPGLFKAVATSQPTSSESLKKPLLIKGVNFLPFFAQNKLVDYINISDTSWRTYNNLFNSFAKEQRMVFLSVYIPSFLYLNGHIFNYLRGCVHPQLLNKVLPGLIELLPLRKAINYADSYIDLYLKGLKQNRDVPDRLQNEVYIEQEALDILKTHSWSENYDELRIILKRCSIFAGDDPVTAADVEAALEGFRMEEKSVEPALKYDLPQKFELGKVMKSTEAHLIEQILKNAKTLKEASEILGFNSPQAFDKRIRALGVTIPAHLGRNGTKSSAE